MLLCSTVGTLKNDLLNTEARFSEFIIENMASPWTSGSINNHKSCCQNRSALQLLCQNLVPLKNIFLWQCVLVFPLEYVTAFSALGEENEGGKVLEK